MKKTIQRTINLPYDECCTRLIQHSKTTTRKLCYLKFIEANPDAGTMIFHITQVGAYYCTVRINLFRIDDVQTTLTAQFFDWAEANWDTTAQHNAMGKFIHKLFDNISNTHIPQEQTGWDRFMTSKHCYTILIIGSILIPTAIAFLYGWLAGWW